MKEVSWKEKRFPPFPSAKTFPHSTGKRFCTFLHGIVKEWSKPLRRSNTSQTGFSCVFNLVCTLQHRESSFLQMMEESRGISLGGALKSNSFSLLFKALQRCKSLSLFQTWEIDEGQTSAYWQLGRVKVFTYTQTSVGFWGVLPLGQ